MWKVQNLGMTTASDNSLAAAQPEAQQTLIELGTANKLSSTIIPLIY